MITLFHFSDMHCGPESNIYDKFGIDASNVIVGEIKKNNLKIDNIIFTGDFAYKEENFEDAINFFSKLSEKLNVDKSKFLFVPGNHEIASKSSGKKYSFPSYERFLHKFYRGKIEDIYSENFQNKFDEEDYSFDYLISDKILISGFHQKDYESTEIKYDLIETKLYENINKYHNYEELIKIAILHEAIQPIIGIDNVDMTKNAGYFSRRLADDGYKVFLTGHSHRSDLILLNNDYLNVSVGPFGLINFERSYNIIKVDLEYNTITVKTYSAGIRLEDPFVLKNQRSFEIRKPDNERRKSAIFELTNLRMYKINLNELLKIAHRENLKKRVLDFLKRNVGSEILVENYDSDINLSFDVLRELGYILDKQVDNLVIELQDIDIPVESKPIYRGKEDGNEIYMTEYVRKNIIEDEIIKKYVKIYIDDVKFIQKDKKTGLPNYKPGKYICIEPATNKHGSVVLPVDKDGNVLLVNQFRHPQRKFITEAIRGFSDFEDDNELFTALREFSEEGGGPSLKDLETEGLEDLLANLIKKKEYIHIDNEQCAIKDIFYLRSLYTDTGKLWEAPHYYLFHVNHKLQNNNIIRNEPIMESPIWVKLKCVLRSIVQNKAVQLENGGIENAFGQNEYDAYKRNHLINYRDPLIEDNKIYIEDAFTSQIVLLSLPRLKEFIDPEIVKDIFKELKLKN